MKRYYKIVDEEMVFFHEPLIVDNMQIINPTEEQILTAGWIEYVAPEPEPIPEPTPEELLQIAKDNKIGQIIAYDNSDAVNSIIVNGMKLWIPADKRAILKTSVDAYKALGIESIIKVWEGIEYTATADQWLLMIAKVEVYASECYNTTARHKAAVEALDNIDDVEAFDITSNYPQILEFNI